MQQIHRKETKQVLQQKTVTNHGKVSRKMSKDIHSSSIPIKHVKIEVLIFGRFRMVLDPLIIDIPIPMLAWFYLVLDACLRKLN